MQHLLEQANKLLQEQKYEEAAVIYEQLLQKEPDNILLLSSASTSYIKTGDFSKAINHLNKALQIAPENPQLYSDRGVAWFLDAKTDKALSDMDKAQMLDPENPYRYSSRAFIRDKAGNTQGAIDDYEKAIALDPEDSIAYNNLGLILEKQGYKEKAKMNYQKADALEGTPPPLPEIRQKEEGSPAKKSKPSEALKRPKAKLNFSQFRQTASDVLTTKKGFKEFLNFLAGKK